MTGTGKYRLNPLNQVNDSNYIIDNGVWGLEFSLNPLNQVNDSNDLKYKPTWQLLMHGLNPLNQVNDSNSDTKLSLIHAPAVPS